MTIIIPQVFGILLTNIVVAIIILLLGFVAGKILGSAIHKLFSTMFAGKKIKGKKNSSFALGLSSLVSTAIYIVAVILALERLGITIIVVNVILLSIIIVILGYILFLIIDFSTNFYFGINILLAHRISKGDRIKVKKIEGIVKRVSLVNTQIITDSGDLYVFSNKILFQNKFLKEKKSLEN